MAGARDRDTGILERDTDVSVRIDVDGRSVVTRTPFLFVGNNEYTIEGIHLGTRARIDAGQLYAYLAPRLHTRELPKLCLWALLGRATSSGAFATFAAAEMWIETPQSRAVKVATDGEITMLTDSVALSRGAGRAQSDCPRELRMRTIVHLSDLHFGRVDPRILTPLFQAVRDATPDLIAVSGDFTQRARRRQFVEARAFLDTLRFRTLVVPGNHDVPLYNVAARFLAPLASYRRYIADEVEPAFIDDEIAVVGLNTARFGRRGAAAASARRKWPRRRRCGCGRFRRISSRSS